MSSSEDYEDISFDTLSTRKASGHSSEAPVIREQEKRSKLSDKKSAGSRLSNRNNAEKRESARVRHFAQTISELSPMFYDIKINSKGDGDFRKNLSEKFKEQKDIVESLIIAWGLDNSSISDRFVIAQISRSVAEMLANGNESIFTRDDILSIGQSISEIHRDRQIFGELLEDDLISSDLLVNIKSSMLPVCVKLKSVLDDLLIDEATQRKVFRFFHETAYALAKDISFNWDKNAVIEDRESLFIHVLSSAGNIVFISLKEQIIANINKTPIAIDGTIIWSWMDKLNKEILNNDMGYLNHPELDIYWLKNQIGTLIANRINDIECPYFTNSQRNIIWAYFLEVFEDLMIKSWAEESNRKINDIQLTLEELSEDEQKELLTSEEFLKPMEIRPLFENFYLKTKKVNVSELLKIDFEQLKNDSSKNFAMFWGLSDAVSKLRTQ